MTSSDESDTPSRGSGPIVTPVTCAVGLGIVMLDNTALAVVLPTMAGDLAVNEAAGRWLLVSFTLANLTMLPSASAIASALGGRRAYQLGLVTFALGSAVVSLGGPFWSIVCGRLLQGAGGGLMLPTAAGLLNANLTRAQRPRGVATWVSVSSIGLFLGPVAGGLLTETFSWRLVFVGEAVIGIVGVVLASRLRNDLPATTRAVDVIGMVLGGAGISLACLAMLEAGRGDPIVGLMLLGSLTAPVLLLAFLRHEKRVANPAFDLAAFTTPGVRSMLIAVLIYNGGVTGFGYVLAVSLQRDQGMSPTVTGGLLFMSMSMLPVGSQIAGRIAGRFGSGWVMTVASATFATTLICGGAAFFVDLAWALVPIALVGLGVGLLFASDTVATMELVAAPSLAAGLANLSLARQVGSVIGLAAFGTVYQLLGNVMEPGPLTLGFTLVAIGVVMLSSWWLIIFRVSAELPRPRR